MSTSTVSRPTFSDEELAALLELIKDADSVELKLTVPEPQQRSTANALGIDLLDAQIRQIFFFETPELALQESGVVVRARRIQGKGGDSVVKLRPVVPSELPSSLRRSSGFRVEVDALPGGFVCSGTLKGALRPDDVRSVATGERPLRKIFTKEQRAYYTDHAPEGITLDDLVLLGPIYVLKVRFTPPGLDRALVGEIWFYPDGSRVLELSTRCAPTEAFQIATELRVFLTAHGVDLGGQQETKTHKALEYFAENLRADAA
jgi:hypothetical protein